MKPTKAQLDRAKAAIPTSGDFAFVALVQHGNATSGKKRAGDAADTPQEVLDRRAQAEARDAAEQAARDARDEALLAGRIEFIGTGRFKVVV